MSLYKAKLTSITFNAMKTVRKHDIQLSYSVLLNKKKKCRRAIPIILKCGSYYDNRFYISVEPYPTEYSHYWGTFFCLNHRGGKKGMAARLFV